MFRGATLVRDPNQLTLRTPEGVEFRIPLAGPATRMLAFLVDIAVIGAISSVLNQILQVLRALSPDVIEGFEIAALFAVSLAYGILCEWLWRGQTVGKRLLRLRVVDAENRRLEVGQVIVRNLLRFVDGLPIFYLVGGLICWLHPKRQRLGDIAAGTIVIRVDTVPPPDLDQLLAGKYNSLAEHRHLAARLRQKIGPELAGLALESLLRREELETAARQDIFRELADRFRKEVPYPPEVVEQLSDEQYVRNVIEILYRAQKDRS